MGSVYSHQVHAFAQCFSPLLDASYGILKGWEFDRICCIWKNFVKTSIKQADYAQREKEKHPQKLQDFGFPVSRKEFMSITSMPYAEIEKVFSVLTFGRKREVIQKAAITKTTEPTTVLASEDILFMEFLVLIIFFAKMEVESKIVMLISVFGQMTRDYVSEAELLLMCATLFGGFAKIMKCPCLRFRAFAAASEELMDEIISERLLSRIDKHPAVCSPKAKNTDGSKLIASVKMFPNKYSEAKNVEQEQSANISVYTRKAHWKHLLKFFMRKEVIRKLISKGSPEETSEAAANQTTNFNFILKCKINFVVSENYKESYARHVHIVDQYLQRCSTQATIKTTKCADDLSPIRLTYFASALMELAENAATIFQETYNIIDEDKYMGFQHTLNIPPTYCNVSIAAKGEEEHVEDAFLASSQCYTIDEKLARSGTDNSSSSLSKYHFMHGSGWNSLEKSLTNPKRETTASTPHLSLISLSPYILAHLQAERFFSSALKNLWPSIPIYFKNHLPISKNIAFERLMQIYSSKSKGRKLCNRGNVIFQIGKNEETANTLLKQNNMGSGALLLEACVTSDPTLIYQPSNRDVLDVTSIPSLNSISVSNLQVSSKKEQLVIPLSEVRDNAYVVLKLCSNVGSICMTIGSCTVPMEWILVESKANNATRAANSCDTDVRGTCSNTSFTCPLHVQNCKFHSLDGECDCPRIHGMFKFENLTTPFVEPVSLRNLSVLDSYISEHLHPKDCAFYIDAGCSRETYVKDVEANRAKEVAVTLGMTHHGRPICSVISYPFNSGNQVVSIYPYGQLLPASTPTKLYKTVIFHSASAVGHSAAVRRSSLSLHKSKKGETPSTGFLTGAKLKRLGTTNTARIVLPSHTVGSNSQSGTLRLQQRELTSYLGISRNSVSSTHYCPSVNIPGEEIQTYHLCGETLRAYVPYLASEIPFLFKADDYVTPAAALKDLLQKDTGTKFSLTA